MDSQIGRLIDRIYIDRLVDGWIGGWIGEKEAEDG
jgi:hypothetical protein